MINEGSGAHSVFVVSGSGFAPSRTVTIRVVDAALTVRNIPQSSGPDGKLGARLSIPCISGGILHFSATDSRPSSQDLTGVIWSNTFSTTCT